MWWVSECGHTTSGAGRSLDAVKMMLIRVPLQSVAAVAAAAAAVPPSPSHRMIAYIDSDAVDKASPSAAAAAAAASSIKVGHSDDHSFISQH